MSTQKQEKTYNSEWDNYVKFWEKISYPFRPNPKQIAFYEKYLKQYIVKKQNPKILIFGSTPEIRDLCSKLKLPATLFDFNEGMYYGMVKLMKRKPYQEKFVQGKWEDVLRYFKKDEFDIIFADEIHTNIIIKLWDKNLKDIAQILKKNGLYFFSNIVMNFDKSITFEELVKKYKVDKKYFDNYQNKVHIFYQLFLGENCYDWNLRGNVLHQLRKKFKLYSKKNKISMEMMKKVWVDERDIEHDAFGIYVEVDPPLGEVYEKLFPHFFIDDIYIDKSHPVYRFRRDMVLRAKK